MLRAASQPLVYGSAERDPVGKRRRRYEIGENWRLQSEESWRSQSEKELEKKERSQGIQETDGKMQGLTVGFSGFGTGWIETENAELHCRQLRTGQPGQNGLGEVQGHQTEIPEEEGHEENVKQGQGIK